MCREPLHVALAVAFAARFLSSWDPGCAKAQSKQGNQSKLMEVRRCLRLRRLSILHSRREAITGPGPGKAISASSQAIAA